MIRALATLTATTRAVGTRATSSVRQPLRPNALRPHGIHKRRRGCGRVIIEALAARPLLVARPGAFLPFEGLPVLRCWKRRHHRLRRLIQLRHALVRRAQLSLWQLLWRGSRLALGGGQQLSERARWRLGLQLSGAQARKRRNGPKRLGGHRWRQLPLVRK